MIRLEIHESLLGYVRELTGKERLNHMDYPDCDIIKRINTLYEDCRYLTNSLRFFKFAVYNIIRGPYKLEKIDSATTRKIMDSLLEDREFRRRLFSYSPKSEFFSAIKDLLQPYLEFKHSIETNKRYDAVIDYKKILDLLDTETMGDRKGKELEEECKKRYVPPYDNVREYKRRMKEKKYKKVDKLDITSPHRKWYISPACSVFYDYIHDMMIDFYKKKGYIYVPVNDDVHFYQFGKIGILSYRYDTDLRPSIKGFIPGDFEFWALLFSGQSLQMDESYLKSLIDFKDELILAPMGYEEEAFIKYLMISLNEKEFTKEFLALLANIGIEDDYCRSNELTTYNGKTFFRDPRKVDDYVVRDLKAYPTLVKLRDKQDEERDKYIKKIIAAYKGKHPEEPDEDLSPRERRKRNPKAWLD